VGLAFPGHVIAVETAGFAVLRNTWSDKLRQRLLGLELGRPAFRSIRESYDGLPMRVAQKVVGEPIFSSACVGLPSGWFRARTDTVDSGAPASFIPGVCIAGPVGDVAAVLAVVPGSARLTSEAEVPAELAVEVGLAPGDVAVLDSRCMRRWSAPQTVFQLSVVRAWVQPDLDGPAMAGPDLPARAARFAGVGSAPATTLESWLFERHERKQ
jgi:hypothetical protein